jgi:processive 1,2-diacylglycerol beta-glucosyltransferase
MIIINPIPGQEAKNTEVLLSHRVAVQAQKAGDVAHFVDEFLRNPETLRRMRAAAATLARPYAAEEAAQDILNLLTRVPESALAEA